MKSIFYLLFALLIASTSARPPLSRSEAVMRDIEQNADDTTGIYRMAIWLPPKEMSIFLSQSLKDKKAIKIDKSKFDILPFMESVGCPINPVSKAFADRASSELVFIDTGKNLEFIYQLWKPALPSSYQKAEQGAAANP